MRLTKRRVLIFSVLTALSMVALAAANPDQVKALHAKALALGAKDEGAPGPRGSGFYGAYFRDLDGNKLNAFCLG